MKLLHKYVRHVSTKLLHKYVRHVSTKLLHKCVRHVSMKLLHKCVRHVSMKLLHKYVRHAQKYVDSSVPLQKTIDSSRCVTPSKLSKAAPLYSRVSGSILAWTSTNLEVSWFSSVPLGKFWHHDVSYSVADFLRVFPCSLFTIIRPFDALWREILRASLENYIQIKNV
jgi:hypothetical protein